MRGESPETRRADDAQRGATTPTLAGRGERITAGLGPVALPRTTEIKNPVPQFERDSHIWLAFALLAGATVSVVYVSTHHYPAYGAGLYLEIAAQVRDGGYALPETIPYYADGIPFAYPPLQFYVVAVLTDLGISGMTVSRTLPAVVTVLYLVPYYGIATRLLPTRRQAGFATVILAVTPPVLQWHLSAGGIVRASAFLLALCGIYAGTRVFVDGDSRWIGPGTIFFALTVLSHPVYTVFFGVSWLVLYGTFDRTGHGLASGAVVALGGLAIASPWWLSVVSRHGVQVFTGAAGSHSGVAGGFGRLLDQFVYPFEPTIVTVFFVASFVSAAVLVSRKKYVLPTWLFVSAYTLGKERFQFVAGAMMISTVFFAVVAPRLANAVHGTVSARQTMAATFAIVLVCSVGIGGFYAGSELGDAHHGSASLPAFMDDDDRKAMEWAASQTEENATFVVLSDAAEWFPYYTKRSILVGPWGVEWVSSERYYAQLSAFKTASTCENTSCLSESMESVGASPTYLYVPNGPYTVRGLEHDGTERLQAALEDSNRYQRVYWNKGVVVYRIQPRENSTAATGEMSRRGPTSCTDYRSL